MNAKYKVTFTEYENENGWATKRIDSEELYDSYEEALKRVKEFNSKNDKERVPDWYIVASDPQLIDLDRK